MVSQADTELHHLMSYLEEEFREFPKVRVRMVQPTTTTRSPDLPQDYDPDSNHLHRMRGVLVRTDRREYFFPAEWAPPSRRREVEELIEEIRDSLE